ncbi:MAG: hypothetical protein G8345_21505 [Magnetococcales bacterium]|nr:hypothetical protein [Magnetococcales bacterium]NGZ29451.1 hypothetical protein [Magnetococcales bacterium]
MLQYDPINFRLFPDVDNLNIQTFLETAQWTKPDHAKIVEVILIGPGGGGGSGRVGEKHCTGGGGGASGGWVRHTFPASHLPSQVLVTVPQGGAGGVAVTTDNTDGNDGQSASDTTFGSYLKASGGGGGRGGTGPATTTIDYSAAKVSHVTATCDAWFVQTLLSSGNGVIDTITLGVDTIAGHYILTCITTATNGGTFSVTTPAGEQLANLEVGVAYTTTHLNLTLQDGSTDFVLGDTILISVASNPLLGTGPVGAIVLGEDAQIGDYLLTCMTATTNGGTFRVVSPSGVTLPTLTIGTAYTGSHINLTIADGAVDYAVGNNITITVAETTIHGTGSLGTINLGASAEVGRYLLTCTASSPGAGTFRVVSPTDSVLTSLTVGVPYSGNHLNMTLAAGATDFAVRDTITIDATAPTASGGTPGVKYHGEILSLSGGTGGPAVEACGVGIPTLPSQRHAGGGGGGGGGIAGDGTLSPGGGGSVGLGKWLAATSGNQNNGGDQQNGDNGEDASPLGVGNGGGGGGARSLAAGCQGGNGGLYGAGGGGGGAALNGYPSGAGGSGAGGLAMVITWSIP